MCLGMHGKDARANGETEQRLYALSVWRETPYYSARERAALEWAEALTHLPAAGVPDDVYERVPEADLGGRAALDNLEGVHGQADMTFANVV